MLENEMTGTRKTATPPPG